jgi:hypothetical protein
LVPELNDSGVPETELVSNWLRFVDDA